MTGFQLRKLQITGPDVAVAEIDFGPGLNVVSGASDTGKSYLVETVDSCSVAGRRRDKFRKVAVMTRPGFRLSLTMVEGSS